MVEEGGRFDRTEDLRVHGAAPPPQPVGDGFASCECTREFDVDRRPERLRPGQGPDAPFATAEAAPAPPWRPEPSGPLRSCRAHSRAHASTNGSWMWAR